MKTAYLPSTKPLKTSRFWLLAIAAGLVVIHLTLLWKADRSNTLGMSLVFWAAIAFLVQRKQDSLSLESDPFSSCLGALLIAWGLLKGLSLHGYDPFLHLIPLIDALGLCLLASGIRGIRQYWQELLCVCLLILPPAAVSHLFDPALLTAKFSAFVLWYLGFKVSIQGTQIFLPTGSVEVTLICSGLQSMIHLFGLAVIFLMVFPLSGWFNKILAPLVAIALAFVTNGLRVALMAVLATSGSQESFEYWHESDASLVFSLAAVMLFGTFCLFLIRREAER